MKPALLAAAALLLGAVRAQAAATAVADVFQYSPTPFAYTAAASTHPTDAQGFSFVHENAGDMGFEAVTYGAARLIRRQERSALALAGDLRLIGGKGHLLVAPGEKPLVSTFGLGAGLEPSYFYDWRLGGVRLPVYAGPHLSLSYQTGSFTKTTTPGQSDTVNLTGSTLLYGWQAGIQAILDLSENSRLVPYLDLSQELGGTVQQKTSGAGYDGSSSASVSSTGVGVTPGIDLQLLRKGLSLGLALQKLDGPGKGKVRATIFNLRWLWFFEP